MTILLQCRKDCTHRVWRAAEAAILAETLERTAKAQPEEVEADTGGLVKAC